MNNSVSATNSRTADKFVVRLPDGMRDLITQVARDNHRSMNSEIIERLEQSLRVNPSRSASETSSSTCTLRLEAQLARAYKVIDRLLQNATPNQEDLQEVLVLFRSQAPLLNDHNAVAGA
ncbi:Arc family DNA-binding protein [Pseudomonas protegens]|uniref:Arc family DNA-binding protein n=1 Tax=Pseudomonas protegens TaxID=380021 RepID=UPI0037FA2FDA